MLLKQLQTLIHVAELGSLRKASARLGIAQPALSRQIKLLERDLGFSLFERNGRGMAVTDTAKSVVDHAARILAEIDALQRNAASDDRPVRGSVAVGLTPTVADLLTVPVAKASRDAEGEISIRIASAFSKHLVEWVERQEIDMALLYNVSPQRSLKLMPIVEEELLLIRAPAMKLPPGPVSIQRLSSIPMILPSCGHDLRSVVDDAAAGLDLSVAYEADALGVMISLVRENLGATILPLAPVRDLVKAGSLLASQIEPTVSSQLLLACSADRHLSPAARIVASMLISEASSLVKRGTWPGRALARPDLIF
jgi:DNA-binding transcriptional LysR family regulator